MTLTGRTGSQTTVTDAERRYRFPALEPGMYRRRRSSPASSRTRQDNVSVSGTSATVDIDLEESSGPHGSDYGHWQTRPSSTSRAARRRRRCRRSSLRNAPITRTAINVLNYAPGINSSSAYGGDDGSANSLLIDGVDTRDPSGGTPWTFYNYNIVQEIQFQGLGAQAEYGGFTGAVVNTITKSGGNRFSGLFEVLGTNADLGIEQRLRRDRRRRTRRSPIPSQTTKYVDLTAQLGGPIKQNKAVLLRQRAAIPARDRSERPASRGGTRSARA